MRLSIILPILNEEQNLRETIPATLQKISKLCSDVELIAVNDGSTDGTESILSKLHKKDKRIKIITHSKNLGYGAALKSGVYAAKYDWIFFTDSDLQFDVSELKSFIPMTKKKYEFIVGYRIKRADPELRKIVSWFYNRTIRIIFKLSLEDVDCAFKIMKKSAIKNITLNSNSFFVSTELMVKAFKNKYRIVEIGVHHYPRKHGKSTVTPKHMYNSLVDLTKLYFSTN